jgi:putative ABC transport system permease protein
LGVALLGGRDLRDADDGSAPLAVVVNRAFRDRYFPHDSPVGHRICFDRYPDASSKWRTIVGVVGDERQNALGTPAGPEVMAPLAQDTHRSFVLVVRSKLPAARLVPALRGVLASIDPALPFFEVRTMDEVVRASLVRERLLLLIFGLFAGLALVLAAFGVYGVTADATARRRREIAVRLAVGASTHDVLRLTAGRELAPVVVGLLAGGLGALGVSRALTGLLFGVAGTDPLTLAATLALLLGVASVAAWLPARRSLRLAPADVLRET